MNETARERTLEETRAAMHDYVTFPRQFLAYRWYKPLLVGLLVFVFMFMFQMAVFGIAYTWMGLESGGRVEAGALDNLTNLEGTAIFTGPGALASFGAVAVMLPALALAALIVRDRPFSSYSSSRGGWNWTAFFKCVGVAVVIYAVVTGVQLAFFPDAKATGTVAFTAAGFVLCTAMVPLQSAAEEYVFRGFALQTFGAWTKSPVVAILASSLIFTIAHGYNLTGLVAIFAGGVVWGVIAWQTNGIEATCAAHIVNNLSGFWLTGLGLASLSSEVDIASTVIAILVDVLYGAAIILLNRKYSWFMPTGDGAARANEQYRAKMERKQQHPQM